MKKLILILLLFPAFVGSQTLNDLEFGTSQTLDIVTWNIEFFPKNGQASLQYVAEIIEAMDADIIAIQEVDDYFIFEDLVAYLNDYDGYRQSQNNRGLAYLYRKNAVRLNAGYEIFTQEPESINFPRFPMVIEVEYGNENFIIINNHFKCCGNGELEINDDFDEETRRFNASNLLKQYIDTNLSAENVILLGDLNDLLIDDEANNVFAAFINDPENYLFVDFDIAMGSPDFWSYPSWPSHLDHILINKNLFTLFQAEGAGVETLRIEDFLAGGWNEYDQNVSDHRPVGIKLPVQEVLSFNDLDATSTTFYAYPNPFKNNTTFIKNSLENANIFIYDTLGQLVYNQNFESGKNVVTFQSEKISSGLYFAHLVENGVTSKVVKLIVE